MNRETKRGTSIQWNIIQSLKTNGVLTHMNEPWKYCAKWKKHQPQKATHMWFHFYEMSRIGKSMEWESRLVVAGGWGEEGKGCDCSWVRGFFGDDETVLELVVVAQRCDYTKNHWIVHFKRANFMVRELYIYKVAIKREKKWSLPFPSFTETGIWRCPGPIPMLCRAWPLLPGPG